MRSLLLVSLFPLMFGCGDGIAGDWSGNFDCESADLGAFEVDLELTLESEGDNVYAGTLSMQSELEYLGYLMSLDNEYDIETELDSARGEQDLELEGDCADTTLLLDGEALDYTCADVEAFKADAEWDGADTMLVGDTECDGELSR